MCTLIEPSFGTALSGVRERPMAAIGEPWFATRSYLPKWGEIRWWDEHETTMSFVGRLIERLQIWIRRYRMALDHAYRNERRRPTPEWHSTMIGDLRRRSSDV
jgi:hypothetical protein